MAQKFAFGSLLVDKVAGGYVLFLGKSRRYSTTFHGVPGNAPSAYVDYEMDDDTFDYVGKLPIRKLHNVLYCKDRKGRFYSPKGPIRYRHDVAKLFD